VSALRRLTLESLSVSTFQLNSVQAAAVAELLRIAPVADRLGELFKGAGHELYLVGGSVRDALLGKLGHDLDFATSARPDAVEKLLRKFSPAVWTIGKEFGTIGCKVEVDDASWVIEVTTYRSDVYANHSRKPAVAFGDTLEADLLRRDFTINAMAVSIPDKKFVDPYGGLNDLARGLIRTPGTPLDKNSGDHGRTRRFGGMSVTPVISSRGCTF
jgi:poly(A) polymerase